MIYDYIPEPIPKERVMPKTVTVEVEIPDGYELAEPKMRPPKADEWFLHSLLGHPIQAVSDRDIPRWILRPIPAEKTWALPGVKAEWLTHDDKGYVLWKTEKPIYPCDRTSWTGVNMATPLPVHSTFFATPFPEWETIPPAERIWRIVERGQA